MATTVSLDRFDAVWDRLIVHLRNAGRTLDRPVTDVRLGEPSSVASPMIAFWFDGEDEGERVSHTLTGASYTERVTIRWYWPISDRTPALSAQAERQLHRAIRATTRELLADSQLGGACTDMWLDDRKVAGWIDLNPGWARIVTLTAAIEMVDEDVIAAGG